MRKSALLLLLFTVSVTFGQDAATDSLIAVASKSGNDSMRVAAMNKIAFKNIFGDRNKADQWLRQSEKLATAKHLKFGYAEMTNFRGVYWDVSGDRDSARFYFSRALMLGKKYNLPNIAVRATNNLGMVYWNSGDFNEALKCFYSALRLNAALPAPQQISYATCYSNIGLICQEMNMYEKALAWHLKAYSLRRDNGAPGDQAASLNNIGICYQALHRNAQAINAFRQGMEAARTAGNELIYCQLLSGLGNSYQQAGKFMEAADLYRKVLTNPAAPAKTIISVSGNIAAAYNELGQPRVALSYVLAAVDTLKAHPDLRPFSASLYQYGAQSHYMIGDIKTGERYNAEFIKVTSDNFSEENARQAANYEVRFKTEQKERELAQSKLRFIEQRAYTRQQNYVLAGISLLAVFTIIIALLVYRQQRSRNLQLKQEHELKSAIARIEAQNQLHEQRLSISRDLHDNIGAQLTFIISAVDNIMHVFRTEDSALREKLDRIGSFAKSTIIELRDTIWAMNNDLITFDDLRLRLLNFIEKAENASGTTVMFRMDESLADIALGSVIAMNLYRVIQEAVNNAIKHACADKIMISAQTDANHIIIEITDDGKGFEGNQVRNGNGQFNMRKRMEGIGGKYRVDTEAGKGTRIALEIPKPDAL